MRDNETFILLFDGVCNFCNRIVYFTIKRDPKAKFKFASLQSETGRALMKEFGIKTHSLDSFIFIKGDKYYLKSSAALNVLKEMGGVLKLLYIFIIVPGPLRDIIYSMVAKSRYKICGTRGTCMIPTPDIKLRFLE